MKTIQILISTMFILTLVVGMPLAYARPIPETASSVHHTSPVLVLWTNGNETIYTQNGFAVPLVSPADTYKPGNSWAAIWENDGLGILLWKENLSAAWTVDTTTNTIASYQNPGDDQTVVLPRLLHEHRTKRPRHLYRLHTYITSLLTQSTSLESISPPLNATSTGMRAQVRPRAAVDLHGHSGTCSG